MYPFIREICNHIFATACLFLALRFYAQGHQYWALLCFNAVTGVRDATIARSEK